MAESLKMEARNKEREEEADDEQNYKWEAKSNVQNVENVNEDEPPDGGWGWVVAIGAFTMQGLSMTLVFAFGLIFSGLLSSVKASSVATALIYNTNGFISNLIQLFAPPLCDVFGLRKVAVFGAIFSFLAIFFSSFANNAWQLFLSYSFLGGIGGGLSIASSFFIIPKYFKKRRGAATAIMLSGSSIGLFGGSLLITYLQEQYGYSGGTLILSAVCLHCLPAALVFQPASWHFKRDKKSSRQYFIDKNSPKNYLVINSIHCNNRKNTTVINKQTGKIKLIFEKLNSSVINNFKMVKSYKAFIVSLGTSVSITGFLNFNIIIPFWLQSIGFSIEEAAWCISLSAITNLVVRIGILFASDLNLFNVRHAYIAATLVLAISCYVLTFITNRKMIYGFICLFGSGIGMNISLFFLVMIDVMGMNDYQPTFGLCGFFKAFEIITIGPLAGWVRDNRSYGASMLFLSSVILFSVILFGFLPLATLKDKRNLERQRREDKTDLETQSCEKKDKFGSTKTRR